MVTRSFIWARSRPVSFAWLFDDQRQIISQGGVTRIRCSHKGLTRSLLFRKLETNSRNSFGLNLRLFSLSFASASCRLVASSHSLSLAIFSTTFLGMGARPIHLKGRAHNGADTRAEHKE